ncbi:MAG: saccharopine dehydrogenase (NAD+, L-lysine-forming) [Litorivivens sp.]|jgi:saccharopine dehydrogenase (NAD+, L-lysine-forming)
MKIGIVRETKNPPDKRVPLSPEQCKQVIELYPEVTLVVQPSPIRKFQDQEYTDQGITLQTDLSDCDILVGVKEVEIDALIANKTYVFFSHTYKLQPYNAKLLKAILDKKIRLVDYEVIKGNDGKRLIGFGRYAGIVGCYNGLLALGKKTGNYDLKAANQCEDRKEMEDQLKKVILPSNFKAVITGFGRVGLGAREIISLLPIKEVKPEEFLTNTFDEPVFTHLNTEDYFRRKSDNGFDKSEFYADPSEYISVFPAYCLKAELYVACHFWSDNSPFFFTREDMKHPEWKCKVVADVSCDIDGPVACTLRPSTIADPLYGYDRFSEKIADYKDENAICVMAVDNLPCELPKDASEDFGQELIKSVIPHLLGKDEDGIIANASETNLKGELTANYSYLEDYVKNA